MSAWPVGTPKQILPTAGSSNPAKKMQKNAKKFHKRTPQKNSTKEFHKRIPQKNSTKKCNHHAAVYEVGKEGWLNVHEKLFPTEVAVVMPSCSCHTSMLVLFAISSPFKGVEDRTARMHHALQKCIVFRSFPPHSYAVANA